MLEHYEPLLVPVAIADLRPTQMTVGFREVEQKRAEIRLLDRGKWPEFLGHHMIPVVRGPKGRAYVIDNHHLVLALRREAITDVLVAAMADVSQLNKAAFWRFMDMRNWLHPFDANGERQPYDAIPKSIDDLADDPYRSLAGALRDAGGYAKESTPYSEFLWADYLRPRIAVDTIRKDFAGSLTESLKLSMLPDANYLPGWCRSEHLS